MAGPGGELASNMELGVTLKNTLWDGRVGPMPGPLPTANGLVLHLGTKGQ